MRVVYCTQCGEVFEDSQAACPDCNVRLVHLAGVRSASDPPKATGPARSSDVAHESSVEEMLRQLLMEQRQIRASVSAIRTTIILAFAGAGCVFLLISLFLFSALGSR